MYTVTSNDRLPTATIGQATSAINSFSSEMHKLVTTLFSYKHALNLATTGGDTFMKHIYS